MYYDLYVYTIYWITYVNGLVKLQQLLFPIVTDTFILLKQVQIIKR